MELCPYIDQKLFSFNKVTFTTMGKSSVYVILFCFDMYVLHFCNPLLLTLTAHNWLPAGTVDVSLAPSDIISVTGATLCLRHGQVTVGVGHGQPAEHRLVRCLPPCTLVLSLDPSPSLLIHVVIYSWGATPSAICPWGTLHVIGVGDDLLPTLEVCSQHERCPLHPRNYGTGLHSCLRRCVNAFINSI